MCFFSLLAGLWSKTKGGQEARSKKKKCYLRCHFLFLFVWEVVHGILEPYRLVFHNVTHSPMTVKQRVQLSPSFFIILTATMTAKQLSSLS